MDLSLVEQFEQARENAASDFEREVLDRAIENGEIAAEDYEDAFNRYRQCAEDAGLDETYERRSDGIYTITPPLLEADADIDEYLEVSGDCAEGTTMQIEALYQTQVNNPGLIEDTRVLTVDCLVAEGLAPEGYTPDELDEDVSDGFADAPFDPAEPAAQECLQQGGYSISVEDGS
ncbi:hypothetical protein ACFOVU_24245 [Nocardiopsis sediminis]|uniref:Uncharacterized protein n=1 Tax=Nocardiopsis sediminis TaxID=1778267 RepID=A0ABV8FSA6_9ACTN